MTTAQAIERIRRSKLKPHADAIASAIRPAFRFECLRDEKETRGCSKLGGKPDLPKDAEWPSAPDGRPLAFLAQFDLSQCRGDSPTWDLPTSGLLSIFYDAEEQPWGIDAKEFGSWRVLHTDELARLAPIAFPKALDSDYRFAALVLKPHLVHSLPSRTTIGIDERSPLAIIDDSLGEAYDELCNELESGDGLTVASPQLGGWPREIQGEMPSSFASLVPDPKPGNPRQMPNPFKPGEMMTIKGPLASDVPPALRSLLKDTQDWTLLLQVPSDEDGPGWMWGDVGRLYYWVSRTAIRSKRFEDVWLELQCY